jgi:hypothetical protein
MDDDFDVIFDSDDIATAPIEAPEPEQHDPTPVEETPSQTSLIAEVEAPVAEAPVDEQTENSREDKLVPLATFLDMRDRMKVAEKAAADAQKQWEQHQQSQQASQTIPDPFNDPHGYADYRFAQVERARINDKIILSGQMAARTHGQDVVSEAAKWAEAQAAVDPQFDAHIASIADPVEWIIQQHKAVKQLEAYQTDPVAEARRIAMEQGWIAASTSPMQTEQSASAITTKSPKTRPTSLTDVPAATGKTTLQSEKESFDDEFRKR